MSAAYTRTGGHWLSTRDQDGNPAACTRKDEAAYRLAIVIRDGFGCVYCGTDLRAASPKEITLDHLECRSQGGLNRAANLVTACRPCNSSRRDRPWREFASGGAVARIERLVATEINMDLARAFLAGEVR